MRSVADIYKDYRIMPQLQAHQLRVAAVAESIAEHMSVPLNRTDAVAACLFHDMGNIIKFLIPHPVFEVSFEPEGMEYWREVQADYVARYGNDEHAASVEIARELGLSAEAIEYIDNIDFPLLEINAASDSYERKLCAYADMRVAPYGVVSIEERKADGERRYKGRPNGFADEHRKQLDDALVRIEEQLQAVCGIDLRSITDATIEPLFDSLKSRTF